MNTMHLIGAEQVSNAASTMREAADRMRNAAATFESSLDTQRRFIESSLDTQRRFMDNWLRRLEVVLAEYKK